MNKNNVSRREYRMGMTLIECLVYVACFAMIVNMLTSTYLSSTRLSALGTKALDRLNAVENVRGDFLRSVHEGRAVGLEIGAYKTGPGQVVLELPAEPAANAGARRFAVWGLVGPENRLAHIEIAVKDGQPEVTSLVRYPLRAEALRFEYGGEPANARLVTCEIDLVNAAKNRIRGPVTYRFTAALRGMGAGQ